MEYLPQILFALIIFTAFGFFAWRMADIRKNILTGKDIDLSGNKGERWKNVLLMALGQKKMFKKPLVAVFHVFFLIGFAIINIKLLEVFIDGFFGTHRVFIGIIGGTAYAGFISVFEILATIVIIACLFFLSRRLIISIPRLMSREMTQWAKFDAAFYLVLIGLLMSFFICMNAADLALQHAGHPGFSQTGAYAVSSFIAPWISSLFEGNLLFAERFFWWAHLLTLLTMLSIIPYSKHLHIILAFPNTYFMKLESFGKMQNMPEITREVRSMMNPDANDSEGSEDDTPPAFGAKDTNDLTWKHLLDAYACTHCGRCTEACPANITGKQLSPRKIMMDTRTRMEDKSKSIRKNGKDHDDGKNLLGDYIKEEEIWACTTCNACVEECPVGIDPLSIILELRRNQVMEEAKTSGELNIMFNNLENNGAPWQFSPEDRDKWTKE